MFIDPLLKSQFDKFHRRFNGDVPATFNICHTCGGPCEYKKLASLLPGEAEYMAFFRNEPIEEFRNTHLDGVLIDGEVIDLLKCTWNCTFINKTNYKCEIRDYKPVICLIYPLYFPDMAANGDLSIDASCKIAKNEDIKQYFTGYGKKIVEDLQIPHEWIRRVRRIDEYDYDYSKLVAGRRCGFDKYHMFAVDELLSYRL